MRGFLSFACAAALLLALAVPSSRAWAEGPAAIAPASNTGPNAKAPLPEPPIEQSPVQRAGLNVAGEWTDSYGYAWTLAQSNSAISGSVLTSGCGTWSVTGAVSSATAFNLTARHPTGGGSGCTGWFKYRMRMTSDNTASGDWDNSAGASGSVTMTRTSSPEPVNFMQVGDATVKPGAVLHFDYEWESSTGDLADLSDCKVGEYVKYPGSANPYNWPSPPWDGSGTPNPTILWVDATDGRAQDNHSSKGFLKPYESATFAAQQKYRFKCGSKTTVFSGWSRVIIGRRVWDRTGRGCWTYRITKSGAEASMRLPGVTNAKCTGAAPMTVAQGLPDFKNGGGEVGMSVSLPDTSVGLHEPIFADLTIFNRRHKEVEVDLGLNGKANLELMITTPAGNVETRKLSSEGFGGAGEFVLAPGGTFKKTLVLNEWYNFPEPGTYRITMTLVDGSSAAGIDRASTNFSVQIGQRNPARLRDIATGLADKAIMGATYAERREPANALSFIDDPVAVDSLVRVLHRGSLVEHYAVNGLGRIGSAKAIAALVAAAHNHPDEDVRAAASSTLRAREGRVRGGSRPAD